MTAAAAAAAMGEGVAPSQSPYVSEPLPAAPSLQTQTQTQSPAPGTPILEEASADAAMKKRKMQKVAALALAQNPTFEEEEDQGEEAVLAAATARKKHKEHSSSPSLSAAAAAETPPMEQETEVIKKPKWSKEEEPPGHSLDPGQAQSQGTKAPHASKHLPAATFLEALAQSPAPGTPMLEQAAAAVMSTRKICKEQKVPELSLAQITTLEEPRDDAMAAKMKESKHIKHTLSSPSTSVAAETTIWEVTKNQKHSKDQEQSSYSLLPLDPGQTQPQGPNAPHASKPLSAAPFREATAQSAAPGTPMLKEAAAAIMRKRKISKEQKLPDLSLAQNTSLEEQREDAVEAKMKKESKNMEHTLSSCSTSLAAETTIWKQELKVTKKQKRRKQQEPSSKSPLQLDPGHTHCVRSQGGKAPPEQEREAGGRMRSSIKINNGKRPRVLSKRELIKEASKKKPVLPEGFVPFTDFASSCTEQNPDHSLAYSAFFDQFRYNPVREDHKPPFLRTPDRIALRTPDRVARLPPRGHSSLESSPLTATETSLAQITTLEEPRDGATAAKMKGSKHIKHTLSSPSTSVAAETTIWEKEVKVTKNQKHSKDQELSSYSLLPLDPGQTQPQGSNAPHASKPLSAAPFREAPAQSPAPGTPMLKEAAMAMMTKRKICKEQRVPDLYLAQNTSLEEQREDAVEAKMKKESKNMEHTLSCCSTSVAAETTIWKQELKVTKKQKQRKQQEPSRKSPLQLDPGHTHCVRSQRGKAREASGQMGSSIKINNGKRPRVLSKRELIKEASTKKPVLPEGFVPFTDFASSCIEQNPDHSSPYSAFFDQFRYNPVREDHKPPLLRTADRVALRTPDRVARLPPRGHSSLESCPLTATETSRAAKFNTFVASERKQLYLGSGSQEKLNVEVKENPQKKKREKKQRKPLGNLLSFDPSQTCCIQLHKAPPEQYQGADAPKVDNIKNSNGKAHVCAPSKRKLFKEMSNEQVLPEGFLAPSDFVPNCTEQNADYSLPSAASFYQFSYRPACQDRNPQPPGTTDRLSMLPPRGYPSFELCEPSVNGTSKANNSVARKSKKKDSGSGSSYGSQEKLHAKEKNPENKMGTKKQREPPLLLTPAEKCSDKYRRVSLDQLVPPPRSPHNLLQEKYASDPWKVIVICMLLNLTRGKQVKNIIEGFFECYPDAHSAINADPEKMAGHLAYLGLQCVKTTRIQKFSKEYVGKEWTYITELCGVGKYAADAYAIFCAGRATEVVPKDHKLVDYWKYVCFELPMIQESQNLQEAAVTEQ